MCLPFGAGVRLCFSGLGCGLSLRCVSSTRNIHRSLGKITRLCQTLLHGNKFDDIDTLKIRTSPQIFNLQTRDSERGVYIVYAPACHVPAHSLCACVCADDPTQFLFSCLVLLFSLSHNPVQLVGRLLICSTFLSRTVVQ